MREYLLVVLFRVLFEALIFQPTYCISVSDNSSVSCQRQSYLYGKQSKSVCNVKNTNDGEESMIRTGKATPKAQATSLSRIDPIKVGFTRQIEYAGKNFTMKTLSLKPPIFEIQDFLSAEECELIIEVAKATGMATSQTLWQEYEDVLNEGNLYPVFQRLDTNNDGSLDHFELSEGIYGIKNVQLEADDIKEMFNHFELDFYDDGGISFNEFKILTNSAVFDQIKSYLDTLESKKSEVKSRKSFSTFLDPLANPELTDFFDELYKRISKLTKLPIEMVRGSEALQVIKYEVSGHYHAHHDSEDEEYAPCCHLLREKDETCRPCRYGTMFYYLNEPIEGGSTAFPFADNDTYDDAKTNREEKHRLNLSSHCDQANLVYKPKKGAALFWYNHVISNTTGWIGDLDMMSYHGGCDVIQGVKWAANNWLNANRDREKDLEIWRNFEDSLLG